MHIHYCLIFCLGTFQLCSTHSHTHRHACLCLFTNNHNYTWAPNVNTLCQHANTVCTPTHIHTVVLNRKTWGDNKWHTHNLCVFCSGADAECKITPGLAGHTFGGTLIKSQTVMIWTSSSCKCNNLFIILVWPFPPPQSQRTSIANVLHFPHAFLFPGGVTGEL